MPLSNVIELEQGGRGCVLLSPAPGVPDFAPEVGYGFELVILSDEATFSVLTGTGDFSIDPALLGVALPRGSYRFRIAAATISSGLALILHT